MFVGIAIFIACLGLFGLAAFTAGRRTKEIGMRKVFGARTRDVVLLLLWQFSIPVLMANAIAWPLAWYYLHNWLEGYAYRISLNPALFPGRRRGRVADRLGHRLHPCPPRRPRQSHPRASLRVGGAMFRNYLVIALRNIIRHKLYSFINIAGLAVGLTCVILIMLFVRDELSYDKWIPGSENLYRVEVTYFTCPGRPADAAGPDRDAAAGRACATRSRKCAAMTRSVPRSI